VPLEEEDGFRVHLPDSVQKAETRSAAEQLAETRVRAIVLERAGAAGATDIEVQVTRHEHSAPLAEGWGDALYLGTSLTARAVGRPRLGVS